MASIKGQPAPKPSSLGSPVPTGTPAPSGEFDDLLGSFDMPDMEQDDVMAAVDSIAASPVDEAMVGDVPESQFAPEPGFLRANVEQLKPDNLVTRLQTGLAANDTEKLAFLQKKFGPENATIKDGKIYYRKDGKGKFKALDPDTFELISDILPDFAREIVTEAAMLPGEIAGFATAGPPGAVVGRVASVYPANDFADQVATWTGIPQDEGRSKLTENAIGMGAEALFPVAGKVIAKRLPGTMAYKAAKQAGQKEVVALSRQSQEVAQAVADLAAEGRAAKINGELVGVPGANVSLMGHQLNPDNQDLKRFANVAASDPKFINAQNQLAEDWGDSLKNTLLEITRLENKGPIDPNKLSEVVTDNVNNLVKAEGLAIGGFKAKAAAKLKDTRKPLEQETAQKVESLMREFGFVPRTQRNKTIQRRPWRNPILEKTENLYANKETQKTVWSRPRDIKALVGKLGLTSEGEVMAVVNSLDQLKGGLDRGFKLDDLERFRNTVGAVSDRLSHTKAGAELGALSGNLRKEYRSFVASGLDDVTERAGFESAMDDFSTYKQNLDILKGALNEDSSRKAIVQKFFTGKDNLQMIKTIKKMSPESYGLLKEEWINQLLTDFASRDSKTGFKSTQFLDALDKKYGRQFAEEVLGSGKGPNLETVRKILLVNERIENQFKSISVDTMTEQQKRGITDAAIGLLGGIKFKTINGISALFGKGQGNALINIMTRDGIDKYVAQYPGRIDKKKVTEQLSEILAQHRVYRMFEVPMPSKKDLAPRVLRAGVREQATDKLGGRED